MTVLWYTWISDQAGVLLLLSPYWSGALALLLGGCALLSHRVSRVRQPVPSLAWLLLAIPPLALNAASAALRGSLMGRSDEVHWQAAIACLMALLELALGLWLVARGRGPLWRRAGTGRGGSLVRPGGRFCPFDGGLRRLALKREQPRGAGGCRHQRSRTGADDERVDLCRCRAEGF
jgi:hypothetical protein